MLLKIENMRKTNIFRHFYISSSSVSGRFGDYYANRGLDYNINVGAKLYILGRAKVLSSVVTDFGPSIGNHVKYVEEMC